MKTILPLLIDVAVQGLECELVEGACLRASNSPDCLEPGEIVEHETDTAVLEAVHPVVMWLFDAFTKQR